MQLLSLWSQCYPQNFLPLVERKTGILGSSLGRTPHSNRDAGGSGCRVLQRVQCSANGACPVGAFPVIASDVLPKERGRGSKQKFRDFQGFPAVQGLRLHASTAGGTGLISGQGTKICLLHSISSVQFSGSVVSDSV